MGEMSELDDFYDTSLEEDYEYIYEGDIYGFSSIFLKIKSIKKRNEYYKQCNFCKKRYLRWGEINKGEWRLFNKSNEMHVCKRKLKPIRQEK